MKLQAHFLAETAQFDSEGFLTIIRGGMTGVTASGFPAPIRFHVVTRLWLEPKEASAPVFMQTRLSFRDNEVGATRQLLNVNPSMPDRIFVNVIQNLTVGVDQPGVIKIQCSVADELLPILELPVDPGPSPML